MQNTQTLKDHTKALAIFLRNDDVDKFLDYYDTKLTALTDTEVKDVKEKALALSEYPESSFHSVLTKLFGKMPALLSDQVSSSSDSSYVSTVTDLSIPPAPEPASPPATPQPSLLTPSSKQMKKKAQRKRKKGSSSSTSPSSMELPPPPPPVLECANNTSASYADMLRKPQPSIVLSECSSESDLAVVAPPHLLTESHSTSCPNIAWEKCPTSQQCKHQQLEFLNESSIANNDNQLANVISISQGDLQSVFDSSKSSGRYHSQTTLRPYSIYNHQSDTISDSHQRLINYFSREWRKVSNSNKDVPRSR